jgi:hypothetical protein
MLEIVVGAVLRLVVEVSDREDDNRAGDRMGLSVARLASLAVDEKFSSVA